MGRDERDVFRTPSRNSVRVPSREAAFSLAVQAAAISWASATACSRGELSGCSCAKKPPGHHRDPQPPQQQDGVASAFRWGGCSSDVEFGAKLSRTFTDAAHPASLLDNGHSASRRLMDSHNSKAGRKAVKLTLQTDCKCHGVSGSCSVRTCWTSLAPFRLVGDHLMARYRAAWPAVALPVAVQAVPAGARARRHPVGLRLALRAARNSRAPPHPARLPRRTDLVFLSVSPNYCDPDLALGSLGTAGRTCNRTSRGADDCGVMCCGRGYNTRQVTRSQQCRCKFHWCCYVHCEVCTDRHEEYTCK
ncbi:protein Wnt-7b-like [Frankliniella occidentalis]|uniref:Protein Wnt n=1 Tax=Frankliniella occidentalis TaxID=133901 RepID=A0A9C6TWK7_FRAOC|nr:protein Wnt-7b-like [Frankliniella occidentalis]